jgi:adenylate cyclase
MSEVFVSYARPDEEHAKRVAEALRAEGHEVWRDDQLPAHRAYAEVIEERLNNAGAIVVLWSAHSAKSQWVRAEAELGRSAGTLVQATVDGSMPPLPFNQIQCADLSDWVSGGECAGWLKLLSSVSTLAPAIKAEPSKPASRAGRRELCICILPFQNMSGDPEQEYFSDGISEDITTDLSKISALGVIARNTAFTFKGQAVNICDIAAKLGVSHVLEGSVRKAGGRVRINAQLINGDTGDHVWAERYDRDLEDIFAIQDEISKAIVAALRLKLLPDEKKAIEKRGTNNVEAYNLYLLARQYWMTGNHGDFRREERVMRMCARAVEIDPSYADAWALLAIAQSSLRYGFGRDVDDGFAAANAALSIDPEIPQARLPIIKRLLERGKHQQASAEMETAIRLGPESWEVNKAAGRFYLDSRDVAAAMRHYEAATALLESDFHAWGMLAVCYHALGEKTKLRKAAEMMVSEANRAVQQDPSNGAALGILAGGYAILGEKEKTREWIERALLVDPDNLNMRYNFACVLSTHLGDKAGALKILQGVFALNGERYLKIAESDPDLDEIREDAGFQRIVNEARHRLGIAAA